MYLNGQKNGEFIHYETQSVYKSLKKSCLKNIAIIRRAKEKKEKNRRGKSKGS